MKISLLGIDGGELGKENHAISFLVDDILAIDAGGLLHAMKLKTLLKIDSVLLSHTHIDHVKDLLLWGDLIFGQRPSIETHGAEDVLEAVRKHLFNWTIWPDFSSIPTKENPVFRFIPHQRGDIFETVGYSVQSIEVNHSVPSSAFIVADKKDAILYSSDTTTTDEVWRVANSRDDLRVIFMEVSFPNRMQGVADASKHYSPKTLSEDLKKIKKDVPIYLYHIKPSVYYEVIAEIKEIKDDRIIIAEGKSTIKI